ncbi:MAG: aminotransferase class I/II-fold pyridoxal phosphate-dependent enzyme [Proteobacteria bacterium]|nr:aminotransferase class I/II-fold pyridoxal phosphate-dependent enzyme [Pseudomonadota bacterium]
MLNPRLTDLPDYPFDRLRTLLDPIAPETNKPPIMLSVGEPKLPPPKFISEILGGRHDDWGKYPPIDGTPSFRRAVSEWLTRRYDLDAGSIDPDRHVLPVSGTREALYLVSALCVPPEKAGQRPAILMPNPFYHVYGGATAVAGAEPVYLPALAENGFMPDIDAVDPAILDRTALFYLCTPSNPQGTAAPIAVLKRAIELARRHDFVLVVDECYAEIYDRHPPAGGLQAAAELGQGLENLLVFHSLSKRSSAAGMRSGFVAGDPNLIKMFRRLRNYVGPQVALPALEASEALWRDEAHVDAVRAFYRRNFDIAEAAIAGRFGYYRPDGGFFLWLDVGDGERATAELWRKAALRVLPGAYIARPGADGVNPGSRYIRVALVNPPEQTEDAMERLAGVLG